MPLAPLYTSENVSFAFQLDWSLTLFWRAVPAALDWLVPLAVATERDGVRVLEHAFVTENCSQFLISTLPEVRGQAIPWSIKGRLQNLVRAECPVAFQRNFDLRSIGSTTRAKAEAYVASQLQHHAPDDWRLRARFADLQWSAPDVDLAQPRFTNRARFWFNLHLVLMLDPRHYEPDPERWLPLREMIRGAADKHGHQLTRIGILPNHLHLTLGVHPRESPRQVALSYLNNLAYVCGMRPIWMHSCFVGTIGEYDLGAVGRSKPEGPRAAD